MVSNGVEMGVESGIKVYPFFLNDPQDVIRDERMNVCKTTAGQSAQSATDAAGDMILRKVADQAMGRFEGKGLAVQMRADTQQTPMIVHCPFREGGAA